MFFKLFNSFKSFDSFKSLKLLSLDKDVILDKFLNSITFLNITFLQFLIFFPVIAFWLVLIALTSSLKSDIVLYVQMLISVMTVKGFLTVYGTFVIVKLLFIASMNNHVD
jgi:hypothetical protein